MLTELQAAEPRPTKIDPAEQSRINGRKSHGPTSEAGKARSSRNSIRHGLTASENVLLSQENPAEYQELLDAYVSYFRPASPVELRLVQKLTNADWRHERGVLMETSLYNMGAAELREETAERDAISQFTEAWKASCKKDSNSFDLLRRYSATLQTQFDKTLAALLKLEKRRPNAEPHAAPVNEQPAKIDPALDITVPVESLPSGKPQVAKQNPYPPRIPIALFPIEPGPVKKVNYVSKLPKPPLPKAA